MSSNSEMAPICMRRLLSIHHHHHHGAIPPRELASPVLHQTLSATLMEENISTAETVIAKWDPNSNSSPASNVATLLQDRDETRTFLRCVYELQNAMVFFASPDCLESPGSRSHSLVRAQGLMQTAMRRLKEELQRMLLSRRDKLDPEVLSSVSSARSPRSSVSDQESEDDIRTVGVYIGEMVDASANAMADLRAVAQAMISTGYGKECVAIYKTTRKSIVYEGLYRLGFEHLTLNKIQKLDWGVLELKVRNWLATSGVAVRTLFAGERILCDHVFDGSDAIRESCFADIAGSAAVGLLGFAESVAKTKKSPEKLFRILDMFSSLSGLWMDIESIFSFESTSAVRAQVLTSLRKLAEAARATVSEFESAVQKDGTKAGVPGGGIHPLTRYAMNYIVFLADYEETLADVYAGFPLQMPPLPESFLDSSAMASVSPSAFDSGVSLRFAWLLVVLLCKLDGKAELYKEPALSYLFLANNLQYMISKVRESRLGFLLGSGWVAKHSAKARHYAASYERIGWARVASAIPPPDAAAEPPVVVDGRVRVFYERFEEAVRVQKEWVVADPIMKSEMRSSVAELLVPAYREFYDAYRPIVAVDVANGTALRFAPEDVMGRVMELFSGSGSGSTSGSDRSWSKSLWWSNSH